MSWLENKIPPPIVVLLVAAAMWPLAGVAPRLPLDGLARWIAASVLGLGGLFVLRAGVQRFRHAATTINPVNIEAASTLVTSGIFAYTRNPMYVGMTLLLLGWAAVLGGAWSLLGPLVFVLWINRFQIVPEERVLSAKFGPRYEAYRKNVRRWI
ncbi:MAG: isoprenylcysteine carboxylmethyltransferase family protein [Hyphomicrobiales bacterium]|nr:MAG: isoprenylcysteine carboxylmethyltransferase family protein [Hyphomicrobiales bacterium]